MTTKAIQPERWKEFCDRFGRQHHRWLVTVETFDGPDKRRVLARNVPLEGVVADVDGNGYAIVLLIVGRTKEQVTHAMPGPTDLHLVETNKGAHKALRIGTPSGMTQIRFRVAALTGEVDGV